MKSNLKQISMFIAGAQKAGTTSLKNYLAQHPQIGTHTQEEMLYFNNDRHFELGYEYACRRYFGYVEENRILMAKHVTSHDIFESYSTTSCT